MPLAITPLTPHLRYAGSAPMQTRTPLPPASEPSPAPVSTADATLRVLRDVERPGAAAAVPQVPTLTPTRDFVAPPAPPASLPQVMPVPDLGALPEAPRAVPELQNVPSLIPPPDACAVEGTDAACTPQ
jgi:hypothetical protein